MKKGNIENFIYRMTLTKRYYLVLIDIDINFSQIKQSFFPT